MALQTNQITLPRSVQTATLNKVQGTSTIAALSTAEPQLFEEKDYLIFTPSAEAEVVAEGGKKSSYEQKLTNKVANRVKLVVNTRISSEVQWADEDDQLQIVQRIQEDQAAAIGRALDYLVYHATDPLHQTAVAGLTPLTSQAASVASTGDASKDLDALADAVNENYVPSGIAMSRRYASDLRKVRVPGTGSRLYPEIPLNLQLNGGQVDGIPVATSNTVNGVRLATPSDVLAIMGDFSMIRWGLVRNAQAEVIEYGDPDNTGIDLKGSNQVDYRTECVLAYAVLEPLAFAVLHAKSTGSK